MESLRVVPKVSIYGCGDVQQDAEMVQFITALWNQALLKSIFWVITATDANDITGKWTDE